MPAISRRNALTALAAGLVAPSMPLHASEGSAAMQSWPLKAAKPTGIHDVAPAPDGGVWFSAQRSGDLGWFDPKTARCRADPARCRLGAARRDPGPGPCGVDHRRRARRDRACRLARSHAARVRAAGRHRQCEPEHRDLRPRWRPLVHRPGRRRRPAGDEERRDHIEGRTARARALRHLHDAARRGLVVLAGRLVHRAHRSPHRRLDRRRAADQAPGRAPDLERQQGPAVDQRMAQRQPLDARPGRQHLAQLDAARAERRGLMPSTSTSATRSGSATGAATRSSASTRRAKPSNASASRANPPTSGRSTAGAARSGCRRAGPRRFR